MKYSKTLRKASYNGISFFVESSSLTFGRRQAVFEYPQKDEPFVEDLGRSLRSIDVKGFIVGQDYAARAKRLIEAFEKPSVDSETGQPKNVLVHPWLGRILVTPTDQPTVSWDINLGKASFSMKFIEAGSLAYPMAVPDFSTRLMQLADELYKKIFGDFSPDGIIDFADQVVEQAYGCIGVLKDTQFARLFGMAEALADLAVAVKDDLTNGADVLRTDLLEAVGIAKFADDVRDWRAASRSTVSAAAEPKLSEHASEDETVPSGSTSDDAVLAAERSMEQGFRLAMLGNALGASTLIGSAYDSNGDVSGVTVSADEVLAVRNGMLNALEREMMLTGDDDADLYLTLSDAYACVYRKLTEQADALGSASVSYTPEAVMPSLVLAYDRYEDPSRDLEIVRRNDVPNPVFVAPEPLRLSRN